VALLYAFVLAGFVESIAGPAVSGSASAAQPVSAYEELCLIDGSGGEPSHEHGHAADCCLHGCRICASGYAPVAHARQSEACLHARAFHGARLPGKAEHPPARIAAAAPFGARGPPSS
jgi:hypothetical protein